MNELQTNALIKSMQASNHIDSIRIYLEVISEEDNQLKSGLEDSNKNIDDCWRYICHKAKEHLKATSGYVQPSIIFGWAIHYYTESEEVIKNEVNLENKKITVQRDMSDEKVNQPIKRVSQKKLSNIVMQDIFSLLAETDDDQLDTKENNEIDEEDYES